MEVNHLGLGDEFEPALIYSCCQVESTKQQPADKEQEYRQQIHWTRLTSRSGRFGKHIYVYQETLPAVQSSRPLRMSYTVFSRSFRPQRVHIIANTRTISTTTTSAAAMSKIIVGPSEVKGERKKGAHWKNDSGTAFKNPWSSFNMPVSMFSARLTPLCSHIL